MSPQLTKEIRPLLLPWALAVGGAVLIKVLALSEGVGEFAGFIFDLGWYAFLGGLALQAAVIFGNEFQYRTLPLLLSQPSSRGELWGRKMFVQAASMAATLVVGALLLGPVSLTHYSPVVGGRIHNEMVAPIFGSDQIIMSAIFLVATACSCCFWTLLTRSTLGGLVITVTVEFLCGLVVALIVARINGQDELLHGPLATGTIAAACLIYCVAFLWLGRRRLLTFELRDSSYGESRQTSRALILWTWQPEWLTCRPTERVLNLVRKEIRLQKPLCQLASLLVVCWLGILAFELLQPGHGHAELFKAAVILYVPLCALLAGCVPLGEEKALGLVGPQLALPTSPGLQWGLKLAIGFASALVLGEGLAWLLASGTGSIVYLEGMNPTDDFWLATGAASAALFLLGFWAIHLVPNTVRAALVAVVGLAGIIGCMWLGIWQGLQPGNLPVDVLADLMCHFQLPPEVAVERAQSIVTFMNYGMVGLVILVLLTQSLSQFRRSQGCRKSLFRYAVFVAMLISLGAFCSTELLNSARQLPNSRPLEELRSALNAVAFKDQQADRQKARAIRPEDLEGRISERSLVWLRNSSITYRFQHSEPLVRRGAGGFLDTGYYATITFPNGQSFSFNGGYSADPMRRRYGW